MTMRWIYGKQDWKTYERGQENCYLMTNGLGGFSSMTVTGSVSRNDHSFLMACVKAPNNRYNMIHRLRESLRLGGREYMISSQEFADREKEEGCRYLSAFTYEDTPVWRFHADGVEIEKEAALVQGKNRVALCYRISNRTGEDACFTVVPFYQFVPKGEDLKPEQKFTCRGNRIESCGLSLAVMTNGDNADIPKCTETYYYSYDACDGRRETGRAKACHEIRMEIPAGQKRTLAIVWTVDRGEPGAAESGMSGSDVPDSDVPYSNMPDPADALTLAENVVSGLKTYRENLAARAGFRDETAAFLAKSADQFISLRESTGGKTILAGYPFFEDWGRDTMIALPGVCISTRRYEDAESILRTFARYERNGLMPNLFPEGKSEPMYNTVDAALLFINCVWLYYQAADSVDFVREMYPVMERIIRAYREGTDYGIQMDEDGLIRAGQELDQVTWMDVRVGEILPTPRHGKPVEINAYWYNALRIMEELAVLVGCNRTEQAEYAQLAEKVKRSFTEKFWMEEKHCLRDVLSGTKADEQIRCNQIWAVSMPFTMLDEKRERQVVDTVFEKLYTPYGLRTLEKDDPEFQPFYGGEVLKRDLAYHQGTVWAYPLGAYYLAYLKVNHYSRSAVREVRAQLEVMDSTLREGCVGQLPEIYDGENPVSSKGCFAQAWSTGEILRVYEALERDKDSAGL